MAITYIGGFGQQFSGIDGGTTAPFDSSGGNCVIAVCSTWGGSAAATLTDNKGNTWTPATAYSDPRVQIQYCLNATCGAGHTLTYTRTSCYASIVVMVFAGVKTSAALDQQNGATNNNSATYLLATGSITPSEANELIITGSCLGAEWTAPASPDSGVTLVAANNNQVGSGNGEGGAGGYKIQTTATPIDVTWSWTGPLTGAVAIASFKASASASTPPVHLLRSRQIGLSGLSL